MRVIATTKTTVDCTARVNDRIPTLKIQSPIIWFNVSSAKTGSILELVVHFFSRISPFPFVQHLSKSNESVQQLHDVAEMICSTCVDRLPFLRRYQSIIPQMDAKEGQVDVDSVQDDSSATDVKVVLSFIRLFIFLFMLDDF